MINDISLVDLYAGQEVIKNQISHINRDVEVKHSQNRKDIHEINNSMQSVRDDIWKLKVKIAGYSTLGGVLTGIALKLMEHLWK